MLTKRNLGIAIAVAFAMWLHGTSAAHAALNGDPNALLSSSSTFDAGATTVDYAVYAPGSFALSFPGEDSPNGGVAAGEFTYAYQIAELPNYGGITQFSVGLADAAPNGDLVDDDELVNEGDESYVLGSGTAPSTQFISASSVRADFASLIGTSAVLYFTSPYGPEIDNATTDWSAFFGLGAVASPDANYVSSHMPEPSSMALAVLAGVVLASWRRRFALK